jgi:excisionase family DNA binding protein
MKKKEKKEAELPFSPVLAAIRLAGGVSKVAELLQVKRPTVYNWIHRGRLVNQKTYDYAAELHRLSGVRADQILAGIGPIEPKSGDGRKA